LTKSGFSVDLFETILLNILKFNYKYEVLFERPERKKPLGRARCKWQYIKMGLK
jgi:hypothetical protein